MEVGTQGTFRDRISANRRNSLFLILAFFVFVLVLGYVIGYAWLGDPRRALLGLALALVVGTVSGLVSYFAGDRMVLAASRAKEITHGDAPQLFNVVEEMTIAGGLPMPKVHIIQDSAPNAFATGRDPEHASVAVTSGLLKKLDRDELQGVIAHEMSHVGNYDIRYAMLVGVLVRDLLCPGRGEHHLVPGEVGDEAGDGADHQGEGEAEEGAYGVPDPGVAYDVPQHEHEDEEDQDQEHAVAPVDADPVPEGALVAALHPAPSPSRRRPSRTPARALAPRSTPSP